MSMYEVEEGEQVTGLSTMFAVPLLGFQVDIELILSVVARGTLASRFRVSIRNRFEIYPMEFKGFKTLVSCHRNPSTVYLVV